jgi:hypothetical protein
MKADNKEYGYGIDSYCPPERHVFTSESEAKAFIISELDKLWADEKADY